MCGLAAEFGSFDPRRVIQSLGRQTHRGPDGSGVHVLTGGNGVLGHRRLAIIDPEGGQQPMVDTGSGAALVANGMIYNYRDLRRELLEQAPDAGFRTASDSEVILQGYRALGSEVVRRLDGMFAFVIADGDAVIAARDPIGIKPLYWTREAERVLFASELKGLDGIAEAVAEFPPGHVYHSGHGLVRYYEPPAGRTAQGSTDDFAAQLRETLEAAVVKRLRSDVPLGVFLSGGLDSSIIAALACRHLDTVDTFAVGIEGTDDLAAARRVAAHLGTRHHELVLSPDGVLAALPDVVHSLESFDPDLVRSAVPCWFVARLAAEHVKVVLTGEGADELFGGYRYYLGCEDGAALQEELRRSLDGMHNVNLQRVDRMTMAHGLEARVPYLDLEMIELAFAIPAELKIRRSGEAPPIEKWVLRQAFADLLPPDVAWRPKAQFDEGSGIAALLEAAAAGRHPDIGPRGPVSEEAWYRDLLVAGFRDPEMVLGQVARWRGAGAA
jgi:asparagine synthase (glutamine-hydrolysing)